MFDWLRSKLAKPPGADNASATTGLPEPAVAATPASAPEPVPSAPEPTSALAFHRAGRLEEAEQAALELLAADACDLEGLQVRGLLAIDRGRPAEALRSIEAAVALAPARADLQLALGRALAALGRRPAATVAFQRAHELQPGSGEPLLQLALLALAKGREDEALNQLSAAVKVEPGLAGAHFHLGTLLRSRGQLDAAEAHYRRAVAARPDHAEALADLGALLKERGRIDEAARHLTEAVRLKPGLSSAAYNLGMLRIDQRRWGDAAAMLRASLAVDPKQADAQYWLANATMGLGDPAGARKAYQAAIRLNGNYVQARWGDAMAQIPAVALTDAEQQAAAPAFAREIVKLKAWFRSHRAAESYRAVGAQQPYYLAYIPLDHRAALADYGGLCTSLMAGWAKQVGVPAAVATVGSKCRVGIVSAHVHSHSVWHAILRGWIDHLDPKQFELHVFHTGAGRDAETESAARRVARLHHGVGDWTAWAKAISDSRLDVLIYPEIGMDATTVRLASLRLARRQLASWGHPITTGLPTIDGFISAAAFEPAGAAAHYTEALITLPRLGCCYRPFGIAPIRANPAAWGIAPEDRVLLCAGTPFKYAPRDDALLVDIARRCSPCKLVFFRAEPEPLSALLEGRLRRAFEAAGLRFEDCVRFIPWQAQAAFFGLLDRADVYLDSVGFSGFNTTMQAVERGTPVVAFEGAFMRGRFASAILRQAGLDEWVADSPEAYARCVERLCADRGLRDDVRGQVAARRAGLFDDRATVAALAEQLTSLAAA
jgi:predicted O-linked N-acetylglucosamine transferase (SPINDLY family)